VTATQRGRTTTTRYNITLNFKLIRVTG